MSYRTFNNLFLPLMVLSAISAFFIPVEYTSFCRGRLDGCPKYICIFECHAQDRVKHVGFMSAFAMQRIEAIIFEFCP